MRACGDRGAARAEGAARAPSGGAALRAARRAAGCASAWAPEGAFPAAAALVPVGTLRQSNSAVSVLSRRGWKDWVLFGWCWWISEDGLC